MRKLILIFCCLLITSTSQASTIFDVEIRNAAGDYTTLSDAESVFDFDITNETTTRVFSFDANSGTIPDNTACTTDGAATSGTCVHQSINSQILITGISGGTFDDDDVVTDGGNTVTLSDSGAGVDIDISIYNDGSWNGIWDGGTYDADNNIHIFGDVGSWDGTCANAVTLSGRLIIRDHYISSSYLCLDNDGSSLKHDSAGFGTFHHLIFQDSSYEGYINSTVTMYDVVFYDSLGVYALKNTISNSKFYNITIHDAAQYGYYSASSTTEVAENIVVCDSGTADFYFTAGDYTNFDYLASCDTTAETYADNFLKDQTAGNLFTDATTDDFTVPSDSNLVQAGVNRNTEFIVDINELTRGGIWDIGAFQYETTPFVPITNTFDIVNFSRDFAVPITTWSTTLEQGSITGYLTNEVAATPSAGDADWTGVMPGAHTFDTNGNKTLYAWLKDGDDDISAGISDTTEVKNLDGTTYAFWANTGEDMVRQDEVRILDGGTVTNPIWDGGTIKIKGAKNSFAQFSVYIEAGENTLTDLSVTMSSLDNGGNTITSASRTVGDLYDFTQTDIELFYIRYLQVLGLRGGGASDSYDASRLPEDRWGAHMQRPCTETWVSSTVYPPGYYTCVANPSTFWEDRPGADKYFPEIAAPIELHPTFDISYASSQQIWTDVWIANDQTVGTYSGTFTVKDNGVTIQEIPVELEVYNIVLPEHHYMKTFSYVEEADYIDRWMKNRYPNYSAQTAADKLKMVEAWRHLQFILRRHGTNIAAGAGRYSLTDDVPADDYRDWYSLFDGTLFNAGDGYNGPGVDEPNEIFVAGSYGNWRKWTGYGGLYPPVIPTCAGDCTLDDMYAGSNATSFSYYYEGHKVTEDNEEFIVKIDAEGTPDTFTWSNDNGVSWEASGVSVTGSSQTVYVLQSAKNVLSVTKASPAVVTIDDGIEIFDDDIVYFESVGGMTELNGNTYTVDNSTSTTFELANTNSSGYGTYTSGGTVKRRHLTNVKFGATTGHTLNDTWSWTTMSNAESAAILQAGMDAIYTDVTGLDADTKVILWTYDEPFGNRGAHDIIEKASVWVDGASGGGQNVKTYVTGGIEHISESRDYPAVDIGVMKGQRRNRLDRVDEYRNPTTIIKGMDYYEKKFSDWGKEIMVYVGAGQTGDATFGRQSWQKYYDGVEWNLLWQIALWINNEGGYSYGQEKTCLFEQASTLGPSSAGNRTDEIYGRETRGNGNGNVLYPGTDVYYNWYTYDADSGTPLKVFNYCTTDGGSSTGLCVRQEDNKVLIWDRSGSFDEDDVVTDGTNTVTLTGVMSEPDWNYGINGPLVSTRLKNYRQSVQDYDLLKMATIQNDAAVKTILAELGYFGFNERAVGWGNIYYGGGGSGYYMMAEEYGTVNEHTLARDRLADIIQGNSLGTKQRNAAFKGATIK